MSDSHQLLSAKCSGGSGIGGSNGGNRVCFGGVSTSAANSGVGEVRHVGYLSENIGSLYLNDAYSDIVLVVQDSRFQAHKVILASRSEYFRALLFGGMRESSQTEIELLETNITAFKNLLRYVYTGCLTLTNLREEIVLEILGLAHKYGFIELESAISDYLKAILVVGNLCTVYGASHMFGLTSLTRYCFDFADRNARDLLVTDGFLHLNSIAVQQLLSRDSFCAPEIEIFCAVRNWVRANGDADQEHVLAQIRLSLISLPDLINTVRDSKLVSPDAILDAIKEQTGKSASELRHRGFLLADVNVATPAFGAQVIEGELRQFLLNGDTQGYDLERGFTRHPIDERSEGIIVELAAPYIINQLRLLLWDAEMRSYSYYVETSIDRRDWIRVIDYSSYICRTWQNLHFPPIVAKYIRVCGTYNSANRVFHLVSLEAYYTTTPVETENFLIVPTENVATIEKSALVLEGVSRSRNALLNGDTEHYDWDSGYTCHQLGSGAIVIRLPQPYAIDSMRLLLWDCDDRSYSYYIEVGTDHTHWQVVADRTKEACKSWQTIRFDRRPVIFIRIVGTHNTANEVFHCVHFECPSSVPSSITESGQQQTFSSAQNRVARNESAAQSLETM